MPEGSLSKAAVEGFFDIRHLSSHSPVDDLSPAGNLFYGMTSADEKNVSATRPVRAWEPLTPRGVSLFARASVNQLLAAQFLVAVLAAVSVVFFLNRAWFPVVEDGIQHMPATGQIVNGRLSCSADAPVQLSQNSFLGVSVDKFHSGNIGREADIQIEFGEEDFRIYSLLGYQIFEYQAERNMAFNNPDLEPWWGAWRPMFLVFSAIAVVASLLVTWFLLATLYCLPVYIISFLLNRDLRLGQSWKLAGASLMPGALFLILGIFCYSMRWIDLIQLGGMMGLHFVATWIYILISPLFLKKVPEAEKASLKQNPFVKESAQKTDTPISEPKAAKKNPFG
jgi:hypothetical protein